MTDACFTATIAALADPACRAILTRVARGETSVTELAKPFKMTLPAISKHLKVRKRADLIQHSRDAQRRPCQLRAQPLCDFADWGEQYRQFWDECADHFAGDQHDLRPRQADLVKCVETVANESSAAAGH